jgi:hypothetical protein
VFPGGFASRTAGRHQRASPAAELQFFAIFASFCSKPISQKGAKVAKKKGQTGDGLLFQGLVRYGFSVLR